MAGYDLIDRYVDALHASLRWRPDVEDLCDEARDHLVSATERAVAGGAGLEEAQRAALERFGEPRVVARAFATTPGGALDAPTAATRANAGIAVAATVAWVVVAVVTVLQQVADGTDVGDSVPAYLVWALSLTTAGTLTSVVLLTLWSRHGRTLGVLGMAGLAIQAVGVVATFGVAWAVPFWMAIQSIGLVLFAVALWRAGEAPRGPVLLLGLAIPIGLGAFSLVQVLELGRVDEFGDRRLAFLAAVLVASVGLALALAGVARWLRSEEPIDLGGAPAAA